MTRVAFRLFHKQGTPFKAEFPGLVPGFFYYNISQRLNYHFQQLIKQITLLHQHQRKKDHQNRFITEPSDIKIACDILFDSIMMKVDDMDASLRQFFENLKEYIKRIATDNRKDYEFSQREIRMALNLCKTSCKDNLNELLVLEYIEKTGGYSNRGFKYKIIYWDDIVKLKTDIKLKLYEQLDLMEGLVAAGEHLQNGHQDSGGTKEKPLVAANFQNTYKRGGKK